MREDVSMENLHVYENHVLLSKRTHTRTLYLLFDDGNTHFRMLGISVNFSNKETIGLAAYAHTDYILRIILVPYIIPIHKRKNVLYKREY